MERPELHYLIAFSYGLFDGQAPVAPGRAQPVKNRLLALVRRLDGLGRDARRLEVVELKAGSRDLVTGPELCGASSNGRRTKVLFSVDPALA